MADILFPVLWADLVIIALGSLYAFMRSANPNDLSTDTRGSVRRQINGLAIFTLVMTPVVVIAAATGLWTELQAEFSRFLAHAMVVGPLLWAIVLLARASTLRGAPIPLEDQFVGRRSEAAPGAGVVFLGGDGVYGGGGDGGSWDGGGGGGGDGGGGGGGGDGG